MNKKYLKENNLYEAHKQFMRLCEWSYVPSTLQEDDDTDDPNAAPPMDDPNGGGDMNAMGAPEDGGMPPMDDPNGGGMPPADDPNAAPPMDDLNGGGDMNAMGAPEDGGMPPMDEPPMGAPEDMTSNDEVIDVDDITNAQEKVNDRVNTVGKNLGKVDDKITNLMNSIDSMLSKIDAQNKEIETLKQEFTKRNPSPTEKLNLRSLDSYPFNVRPDDYWREKSATSNYQGYTDNEEPTSDEYTITNDDVDDFDERKMADSFFIDDDMQQDIEKIFRNF